MDIKTVKQLVKILNESSLSKLEVEENNTRIMIEKEKNIIASSEVISASPLNIENEITKVEETKSQYETIDSPLVGKVYLKPSPEDENFVQVNQKIKKGDVLCIIEAMKVMNEVRAIKDGTIKEILVENEDNVGFDTPLFFVE